MVAKSKVAAKWFAALKNADNLVKDILHAADINQDGEISFEGPFCCPLFHRAGGMS